MVAVPLAVWVALNEPQLLEPQVTVQSTPALLESLVTVALIWTPVLMPNDEVNPL